MELLLAAKVLIAALRRRKVMALAVFLTVLAASLSAYQLVGRRYNAEALLLVGNGVKDSESRSVVDSRSIVDPTGINSLARLAETNDVVREAAKKVGLQRLFPDLDRMQPNGGRLREAAAELGLERLLSADQISNLREAAAKLGLERLLPAHQTRRKDDILISMLRRSMSAQAEGKTDLLKISFPHRDPVIAAEFVNALADALVAKQVELLNVPGAFQFFDVQRKQLQEEVQKAATRLESFSAEVSIYSINDQRTLLLHRADQLTQSLSSTQGSIVELQGQKEALTEQLLRLKPVTQSQYVSGLVSSLGATNVERAESSARTSPAARSLTEAPPLLLIRVYQDTMAALFKVDADFAGTKNREAHLGTELQRVNKELAALSSREAEYNRLSRDLTLAVTAAESYAKRTTEERINTSLANARVSGLRIAQFASPPDSPAFPQLIIFLALGLVGGIVLASAAALLPEALASVGTYDAVSLGSAEAATHVRSRAETERNPTSFNFPAQGVTQALSAAPPASST
ncbi:GumC family protein [Bradyrhizobium erythrophlei]|uniref:GumC family protein n=1 Tax=Bradyrhizobium erythrophlei TaxID=1437360 RepID=UPI0035ED2608